MESPEKKFRIYAPSSKENYNEQFKSSNGNYTYQNISFSRRYEINKTLIHKSNEQRVKHTKLK